MPRKKSNVWEYFEIRNEIEGRQTVSCNYCYEKFKRPNATKMKEHLLKCRRAPADIRSLFLATISSPIIVRPLSTASIQIPTIAKDEVNLTPAISPDEPSLNTQISSITGNENSNEELDAALARAIYASGMPLSIFESRYWKEAFNIACPTYELPSRASISVELLEAEYIRVKEAMNIKISQAKALALVLDGWTNIKGKSVINFLLTTPDPVFLKSITPGTQAETAQYLAEEIKSVIEEIGSRRFICVITDNASNMRAAWRIIGEEFINISCVGCAAHTFNLLFQDIAKKGSCMAIIRDCKKVIKYIKKRNRVLACFTEKQKTLYGENYRSLKLYCKTRWGGAIDSLKSLQENREALELLVVSQDVHIETNLKDIIVSHETWRNIDCCLGLLSPIGRAITIAQSNNALLSDIPHLFYDIKQTIQTQIRSEITIEFITPDEEIDIVNDIDRRREFITRPIHLAANLLDPRYKGRNLLSTEFASATDYLTNFCSFLNQDLVSIMTNLAEFRTKSGFWSKPQLWLPIHNLEPRLWWEGLCDSQPIASVAIKILSVPSSASAERNWSLFARTHTKSRNRLTDDRVNKLVTISANLQYMEKIPLTNIESESEDEDSDNDPSTNYINVNDEQDPLDNDIEFLEM